MLGWIKRTIREAIRSELKDLRGDTRTGVATPPMPTEAPRIPSPVPLATGVTTTDHQPNFGARTIEPYQYEGAEIDVPVTWKPGAKEKLKAEVKAKRKYTRRKKAVDPQVKLPPPPKRTKRAKGKKNLPLGDGGATLNILRYMAMNTAPGEYIRRARLAALTDSSDSTINNAIQRLKKRGDIVAHPSYRAQYCITPQGRITAFDGNTVYKKRPTWLKNKNQQRMSSDHTPPTDLPTTT